MKTLTCVGILIILIATFEQIYGLDDVPEFQYPCFVDVCTFPHQYCNSDRHERRCSQCSPSICREERRPTACKYICMKYAASTKTSSTVKPTSAPLASNSQSNAEEARMFSLQLIMIYCAVTTTLIAVLLIVLVAICSSQQCNGNRCRHGPSLVPHPQASFKSIPEEDMNQEQQKLLQTVGERLELKTIPLDQTPPSYTSQVGEVSKEGTPDDETRFVIEPENSRQSTPPRLLQIRPTPDEDRGQHHMPWKSNGDSRNKTSTGCQSDLSDSETPVKHSLPSEKYLK